MTTSLQYLPGLKGAKVTLDSPPGPPFYIPPKTWQIVKLDESANVADERDIADGLGPGYVAGKFLCQPAGSDDQQKLACMRIYKQIPTTGTEFQKPKIRAAQATEPHEPLELGALKAFKE
ncbi:unnamed protein product [Penicillium egyptiacum]|uniref:Uncharacterized protein n=1 Tax=Penicillium egyptiacum TaxID=1303716 RepID=A0A9W4KIG2_9EURO|nr:unnamed protein product [Penicillium egyptiacum]